MSASIYFDYAAATPLDERVVFAMQPYLSEQFYNPSALYAAAHSVRGAYEEARHVLAKCIGAKQYEIIITAGATESINLAIHGVIGYYGGAVAVAGIEHLAVIESAKVHDVQHIDADERGYITPASVHDSISPDTTLVSVGYINNELGTVQPLRDIATIIEVERQRRLKNGEKRPLFLHTDASQAAGMLDCSASRLGVDLMTLNAAKCYGPKQVGLLWTRAGINLRPLVSGGSQERSLRAGTENIAGAIGFAKALQIATDERKQESHRLSLLRDKLEKQLIDTLDDLIVNGHPKRRAPHILHVSIPGLDGERAIFALDQAGIMAATGSACAANSGTRSHVLTAIGYDDARTDGSIRCSFGRFTTEDDIIAAGKIITEVVKRERQLQ